MIDNTEYYNTNKKYKEYVDKYCTKHDKSVEEALKDNLIQYMADFYREKEKQDVKDSD